MVALHRSFSIKWHGGDKGSKLVMNARTGTLTVRARDWGEEGTDRGCIACRGVIETIEHVSIEYVFTVYERFKN